MLIKIIEESILDHDFELVFKFNNIHFFKKDNSDHKRYIIVFYTENLIESSELNDYIISNVPHDLLDAPSFSKNTDLIVLYKIKDEDDYKKNEKLILDIEENAYHFKKYVLYYTSQEIKLLEDKTYKDVISSLTNHEMFSAYKKNPLLPTSYSLAAKIFIKLPFLSMPDVTRESILIADQIKLATQEIGLEDLYNTLDIFDAQNTVSIDNLIEELINAELEDCKNKD